MISQYYNSNVSHRPSFNPSRQPNHWDVESKLYQISFTTTGPTSKRSNQRPLRRTRRRLRAEVVVTKRQTNKEQHKCFVLLVTIQRVSILSVQPRLLLLAPLFRRHGLNRQGFQNDLFVMSQRAARWRPCQ